MQKTIKQLAKSRAILLADQFTSDTIDGKLAFRKVQRAEKNLKSAIKNREGATEILFLEYENELTNYHMLMQSYIYEAAFSDGLTFYQNFQK